MIGENLSSNRLDDVGNNEVNLSEDYQSNFENYIKEKRKQNRKLYHGQAEIMAWLRLLYV